MKVKVYVLGGARAEVILVGTLVLSQGRVVIEEEDSRYVGMLANTCAEPIRVWFEGQKVRLVLPQEHPEEFLRWLPDVPQRLPVGVASRVMGRSPTI